MNARGGGDRGSSEAGPGPRSGLRVAVIGGGPMGLACAYEAQRRGHQVCVYEAEPEVGGMSASFDFDGLKAELFYHFICKTDEDYLRLLSELGLTGALRWRDTRMGYFHAGRLEEWGSPSALLRFSDLTWTEKLRYALHVLHATRMDDWSRLQAVPAEQWLAKWLGRRAYEILWRRLLTLKFHEHQGDLSAAWMGARLRRLGRSRRNPFKLSLGYLEGGSETLLSALVEAIRAGGGAVRLNEPVEEVICARGCVQAVRTRSDIQDFDRVISTIPLPYLSALVPGLPKQEEERIRGIPNIAVATVVVKLKRALTPYFWINVADPATDILGIIEYSNLNPLKTHLLYVPYYMPQHHPQYRWPREQFYRKTLESLQRVNPEFSEGWVTGLHLSRYEHGQPICQIGFSEGRVPTRSSLSGLYLADTSSYMPDDRCINASVKLGRELARGLDAAT